MVLATFQRPAGHAGAIAVDGRVHFPHSLGVFYQALTQYLDLYYGDEYKVMGLAPYGKPAFIDQMRRIVRLNGDGAPELDLTHFGIIRGNSPSMANGSPEIGDPSRRRLKISGAAQTAGRARGDSISIAR
jgi:carbamoyltransferase